MTELDLATDDLELGEYDGIGLGVRAISLAVAVVKIGWLLRDTVQLCNVPMMASGRRGPSTKRAAVTQQELP